MTLPDHLFTTSTGGHLYDCRAPDWSAKPPLRTNYCRHHTEVKTTADLRATLRAGQYAWPGGYQLFFVTMDGCAISFEGARKHLRDMLEGVHYGRNDRIVAVSVNYEDADLRCDLTDKPIPAAYVDEDPVDA